MSQLKKKTNWIFKLFQLILLINLGQLIACSDDENNEEPDLSNVATLNALAVSVGELSPAFASLTFDYSVNLSNEQSSIVLTPTTTVDGSIIRVDGVLVNSGEASAAIDIDVGESVIEIEVTAEDGVTRQNYRVNVSREALSNNANLANLILVGSDLSPAFVSDRLTYSANFENSQSSTQVTATEQVNGQTIRVNGQLTNSGETSAGIDLVVGENVIEVLVTAEDGTTTQTYQITANRAAAGNNDALLSDLKVSTGTLNVPFEQSRLSYTANTAFFINEIVVTPTPSDPNARVVIAGQEIVSGGTSNPIPLQDGDNMIAIQVIAEDGVTSEMYQVNAYRYSVDAMSQIAYLKSSNSENGDNFGFSVAISGDTMVVGAPFESGGTTGVGGDMTDNSQTNSGAVYVFARAGLGWRQQAYLKASNTDFGDAFGYSVDIDGDTIIVGAHNEDSIATGIDGDQSDNSQGNSGAAYVFIRDGESWIQQAYLKASNSRYYTYFGYKVAIDGETIAVAGTGDDSLSPGVDANQASDNASFAGAVYIFNRENSEWRQQAYIKASNPDANDFFGFDLALDKNTLAVSAKNESSNGTGVNGNQENNDAQNSGAVYVFARNNNAWSQQAYLKSSNSAAGDAFGQSLSLFENTLVVGAPKEDSRATGVNGDQSRDGNIQTGAAYVFVREGTTWSQQAYLKASNTEDMDEFGAKVSVLGDLIAVFADNEASSATGINGDQSNNSVQDSGAVYLFNYRNDAWAQAAYAKASNTGESDRFGHSIALDNQSLVIGAFREQSNAQGENGDQTDNSAPNSGALYVFKFYEF